jgi:hypothetical protein
VHTARHGRVDCARPVLLDPFQFQLGDQRQDPDRDAAHRCGTVEVVFDRDQPRARFVESLDRLERIHRGTREAIKAGNDDAARLALLRDRRAARHGRSRPRFAASSHQLR